MIFNQDVPDVMPPVQLNDALGNVDSEIFTTFLDCHDMFCHGLQIPKHQNGIKLFFPGAPGTVRTFAAGVTL